MDDPKNSSYPGAASVGGGVTAVFGLIGPLAPKRTNLHERYHYPEQSGTPRRSYDINLYKAGLRMADAMPAMQAAGALLGIDATTLLATFGPHAERPLDHISAGLGRDGQPLMTWYWEEQALP